MAHNSLKKLTDPELADLWVAAYQSWAVDYRDRDARADLDAVTAEIRLRGLVPPRDRVAAEIADVAAQMRSSDASIVPGQAEVVGRHLEDDLMSFVDEAKRMVPESRD
jgi:hypothetical protein